MKTRTVSLLLPYNEEGKILIQDRRGFRDPPWGYFGGGVELLETHLDAVVRESMEELNLNLGGEELDYLGKFEGKSASGLYDWVTRHVYLWRIDERFKSLNQKEGKGMRFVNFKEGASLLSGDVDIDILRKAIKSISN